MGITASAADFGPRMRATAGSVATRVKRRGGPADERRGAQRGGDRGMGGLSVVADGGSGGGVGQLGALAARARMVLRRSIIGRVLSGDTWRRTTG